MVRSTSHSIDRLHRDVLCLNETLGRTDGLIVSDQDSIRDAWAGQTRLPGHFYGNSFENVTALGIKAGCDQNDGHTYSQNGMTAVQQGLMTEHDVRQSVPLKCMQAVCCWGDLLVLRGRRDPYLRML